MRGAGRTSTAMESGLPNQRTCSWTRSSRSTNRPGRVGASDVGRHEGARDGRKRVWKRSAQPICDHHLAPRRQPPVRDSDLRRSQLAPRPDSVPAILDAKGHVAFLAGDERLERVDKGERALVRWSRRRARRASAGRSPRGSRGVARYGRLRARATARARAGARACPRPPPVPGRFEPRPALRGGSTPCSSAVPPPCGPGRQPRSGGPCRGGDPRGSAADRCGRAATRGSGVAPRPGSASG